MEVGRAQRLDIRPLSGHTGAEIEGVDLSHPLSPAVVTEIRAALLKWKVVFFRDQDITRQQHIAFGRLFGDLTPAHPTLPAAFPEHPEVLLLDNRQFVENSGERVERRWHSDVTFLPAPPMGSVLRAVVVPEYGGDTHWTNLVVAYQELSEPIRTMISGLHAVHDNTAGESGGRSSPAIKRQLEARHLWSVHPVVRVHPETGERALFVNPNFVRHIVELSKRESAYLLASLYDHMTSPGFTARFRWSASCLAFWDNRATAHLAPNDVPVGAQRVMERITIAGDVPFGPTPHEWEPTKP